MRYRSEKWRHLSPRWVGLLGSLLLAGIVMLVVWEMRIFYLNQQTSAQSRTGASADVVAEWLGSALETSRHALESVEALYQLTYDERIDTTLLTHYLAQQRDQVALWDEVGLLDPQGNVLASTLPLQSTRFDVGVQDVLSGLVGQRDRRDVVSRLYWSERANGLRLLHLLRVENSVGEPEAYIVARLNPAYFVQLMGRLTLNEGASLALLDATPRVIMQRSQGGVEEPAVLGREVSTPELAHFLASDQLAATWERVSPVDDTQRLFSARRLSDAPWLVISGEDTTFYLHDWWRRFWIILVGVVLLAALGATAFYHYRRLYAAEKVLREHRQQLTQEVAARKKAQQATELEAAQLKIAAMAFETHLGMFIADADNRIVQVNHTFSEITGYDEKEVVGLTPAMLNSGRHDAAFYRQMWLSLNEQDRWQGEVWNRRKNGEVYPQWLTISVVRNDNGAVTHYVATLSDITQRKAAEQEIHQLAFFDALTGLPNRRLLIDRIEARQREARQESHYSAVMFIDLDNFKTINDSLGHYLGDALLVSVAKRLAGIVRDSDTAARLGGDEFVVMLHELGDDIAVAAQHAEGVAYKLLTALREPLVIDDHPLQVSGSIGVTLFAGESVGVSEILQQADLAMYQAKASGRNALCFFDPSMQAAVMERAQLESDLRHVIERQQLSLYYQTQVNERGQVVGVEALVRWLHPKRGIVSPGVFIPLAEETHLIGMIGEWVLETACRQLVVWSQQPPTAALSAAVNVSPNQFRQEGFVEQIKAVLARTGANPQRLKLEVTESLLMEDIAEVRCRMEALRQLGIRFSLDDFGTGYSSLAYLKQLPLDQLKIDQSFVRDVLDDPADAAIVRTVIALAHSLELEVIAEGVETQAHRDWLFAQGCLSYQGYFFSRPQPTEHLRLKDESCIQCR
ncbi:EAL domain-containing protein [Halomonas sp. M1]|uniref:bifunctional diguanylate cyclase/phosphodiesterase n=1 Tax=Halomonas sp. M1 TaxID=3035470 RepID=UPI0024867010|nr:EAL domain-containing protein [Halomonas sp. M1]WFE70505.1 EAL domain-containing protein [Halomonas sp. M1]